MSGPVAGLIGGIWAGRHGRASRTSSRSTSAARRRTSASPPAASCACATSSTRRSATTRRWCRWSTSTRSAPAAARSPTSTRAASSASGPQSAGADPGPACYGRGGTEPTSTDAQLLLGRLRAGPRPARRRHAARPRARRAAPWQTVADELGMTRRGGGARRAADPEVRDDAGDRAELGAPRLRPARVHARRRRRRGRRCSRATSRSSSRSRACSCPPHPGIIAATGLLATDLQHEFVAHRAPPAEERSTATRLAAPASTSSSRRRSRQLEADGVPEDRRLVRRLADCRYAGQGYEVRFEVPAGDDRRRLGRGARRSASTRRTRPSTATASTREIEIINIRVVGIGRVDELQPAASSSTATATRRGRDARARGRLRGRRQAERARRRRSTSASACAPATGSRARRSSSSTTRRRSIPPGLDGRDRPLRQHRHRLHDAPRAEAAAGAGARRRRSSCA